MSDTLVETFAGPMSRRDFARFRVRIAQHNQTFSDELKPIPRDEWPPSFTTRAAGVSTPPIAAWRSRRYVAILYSDGPHRRLSVNRTTLKDDGRFEDGLTWDELQEVKRQVGFGNNWAVEVFPPQSEIVNVSNLRHLWLLPHAPAFAWKTETDRGDPAPSPRDDGEIR